MENIFGKKKKVDGSDSEHWMGVSDLMAGLMMVFLFIAIAFMRYVQVEQERIKEIAVTYQDTQVAIYESLMEEFSGDLEEWQATISKDSLAFRFQSPDVLFGQGEITLRSRFRDILDEFFPRYLAVLSEFEESIDAVRIEGHTSSIWNRYTSHSEAYFKNMALSQGRTRSVLEYVYSLTPSGSDQRDWVESNVAAVGYSSSRPILTAEGEEDTQRSRRVTFRVLTNAETQIRKILED